MRRILGLALAPGCIPHLYSDGGGGPAATCADWVAPSNSWGDQGTPPECREDQGYGRGQQVPDVRLADQFGDEVSLWQFAGDLILLDVSTLWCGPCKLLGAETESTWQTYQDQGFVYVTVIQQDVDGAPAEPADVQVWVDTFGLTAPVLLDPDAVTTAALETVGGSPSFPGVILIGRDLDVIQRVGTTVDEVETAISTHL